MGPRRESEVSVQRALGFGQIVDIFRPPRHLLAGAVVRRRLMQPPAFAGRGGGDIELVHASLPSPTLPARGRVSAGAWGTVEPKSPRGTSPLAGEVGRGGAVGTEIFITPPPCSAARQHRSFRGESGAAGSAPPADDTPCCLACP